MHVPLPCALVDLQAVWFLDTASFLWDLGRLSFPLTSLSSDSPDEAVWQGRSTSGPEPAQVFRCQCGHCASGKQRGGLQDHGPACPDRENLV